MKTAFGTEPFPTRNALSKLPLFFLCLALRLPLSDFRFQLFLQG